MSLAPTGLSHLYLFQSPRLAPWAIICRPLGAFRYALCFMFGSVQWLVTLSAVVSARNLSFQLRTYLDRGVVTGIAVGVIGQLVIQFRRGRLIRIRDDGERLAVVAGL